MQAYRAAFAKIYNLQWGGFARQVAPLIKEYYESTAIGEENKDLLDLCCGTGQLAHLFLEAGYRVIGIDLSADMLAYARENNLAHVETGQAHFIQADAARFALGQRFGLVVSTYDALNHLESFQDLRSCFKSVLDVLAQGGIFVFDLNTPTGLQRWNSVSIEDNPDLMLVRKGFYNEQSQRAVMTISGFIRSDGEMYERFEETVFNTVFSLREVEEALLKTGFQEAHAARVQELSEPLAAPENEGRVFFVAKKP